MKPLFWHILIALRQPQEQSVGGIVMPDQIKEAEAALTPVGQVVAIGPMAFATKTTGGHDYAIHKEDVQVGTWVMVSRKIGVPFRMKDGRYYQLINDYEIMGTFASEAEAAEIKAYI